MYTQSRIYYLLLQRDYWSGKYVSLSQPMSPADNQWETQNPLPWSLAGSLREDGGGWGEIPMGQLIPLVTSSAVLSMSRGEPAPSLKMASTWVWLLPVNINSTILISDKLCLCRSPCRALSNCGSGLQRCNYWSQFWSEAFHLRYSAVLWFSLTIINK